MWLRWSHKIAYVTTDEDDEPMKCVLCGEVKSAGKLFPLPDGQEEFICNASWLEFTMKLMQMPDPDYLIGGRFYRAE